VPLPLKLVGGAILLAAVFLVAAILGGGNSRNSVDGAAPLAGGDNAPPDRASSAEESTEELGYPAFATKNTTRIGGDDPAANAAGAALAVFPATDEAQRPAAVTLVDDADPEVAIAAAVLMAAPVRAPVLVAGEDGIPAVSAEALAALDPGGSSSTGGASVFAIGAVPTPAGYATRRVRVSGAAAGAAAIAKLRDRLAGSPPRHIVVAPLGAPAFAMPAAAWAARSGDPILYAGPKKLPKATARVLRSHPKAPAYVLGPSSAISSDVLREVAAISRQVRRVAGEDPVANAIALARYDDGGFGWNVNDPGHGFVVARSDEPLDAAAASPLSAAGTWGPLLLTDDAGTLPAALRGYLLDVKPGYTEDPTRAFYNHVWVIGDQEAIEVGQQAEIDALAELAKIGGRQ
jgi:Cell wall binding domain 2 (CWB2)